MDVDGRELLALFRNIYQHVNYPPKYEVSQEGQGHSSIIMKVKFLDTAQKVSSIGSSMGTEFMKGTI